MLIFIIQSLLMQLDKNKSMKVVVRVRPLTKKQNQSLVSYEQFWQNRKKNTSKVKLNQNILNFFTKYHNVKLNQIIKIQQNCVSIYDLEYKNAEKKMKDYIFSHVYGKKQTNVNIFNQTIKSQINSVIQGYNCSILAYGITGSGKTFSVFGHPKLQNQKGLCHLAIDHLFKQKQKIQQQGSIEIKLSFLQIYNQNIRDLLSQDGKKLVSISEDNKGQTIISDSTEIIIKQVDEATKYICQGITKRTSAATQANILSSRSHAIVKLTVTVKKNNQKTVSKLFIIDLAGCEKINLDCNLRKAQGTNINKSLLSLGNCINALVQNSKKGNHPHIPFRDSKLTRLLKDSLGGNAKTVMIACISPHPFTIQQTVTTLNYAQRAQVIKKELTKNTSTIQMKQSVCKRCKQKQNQFIKNSNVKTQNNQDQIMTDILGRLYKDIIENAREAQQIQHLKQIFQQQSLQFKNIRISNQNQRQNLKNILFSLFSKIKKQQIQMQQQQHKSQKKKIRLSHSNSSKRIKKSIQNKQNIIDIPLIQSQQKSKQSYNNHLVQKRPSLMNSQNQRSNTEFGQTSQSKLFTKRKRQKFEVIKKPSNRRSNSQVRAMTQYQPNQYQIL